MPARMAVRKCAMVTLTSSVRVTMAGGFGAERVLPGLPGRPRRLRRWPAVPSWRAGQDPPAPAVGRQIPDRPGRTGISAIAATRSAGLRSRRLGCFVHPRRPGGNDHGGFRSQFWVQAFEKPSGRPDLNRRPLDPQSPSGHRWASPESADWALEQSKRWPGVAGCGLMSAHVGSWNGSPAWAPRNPCGAVSCQRRVGWVRLHVLLSPLPSSLAWRRPRDFARVAARAHAGRCGR
jgi:hypothetical protein